MPLASNCIFKPLLLMPVSDAKTIEMEIFERKIRQILNFLRSFLANLMTENKFGVDKTISFSDNFEYFVLEDEICHKKDSFWRIAEKIYEKYTYDINIKYLTFSIHRKNDKKINCEAAGNLALITLNDKDLEMLTGGDILKLLEEEISRNTNEEFEKMKISRIVGTILHEIGHLLDLGHVKNTVMSDKYWKIGKFLVRDRFCEFRCFDEASLSILSNHKWMNSGHAIVDKLITFDQKNRIVRCEDEIYAVQIRRFEDGETLYSRIFDDKKFYPIKMWTLPAFERNSSIDHQKIVLFVMIRSGNTARFVTSVE